MIRDVYLHGAAGLEHGRHRRLDVASPAEAVRALMSQHPPLKQVFRAGQWRVIVGSPHLANAIEPELMRMNLGSQPVHIVPAAGAAGDDLAVGKIVVGAVLIGATIATAGLAAPAAATFGAMMATEVAIGGVGLGISYTTIAMIGASMVLGGIGALLTQSPIAQANATDLARPEDRPSFLFNGVVNNTQQGGPVPLVFGTHLVGSIVVSAGLNAEDIAV